MSFRFKPIPHFYKVKDLEGTLNGTARYISITLDKDAGEHTYIHELLHVMQQWILTIVGAPLIALVWSLVFGNSFSEFLVCTLVSLPISFSLHTVFSNFWGSYKHQIECMSFGAAANLYSDDLSQQEAYMRHVAKYMADGYDVKYHWTDTFYKMRLWHRRLEGVAKWLHSSVQ